MQHIPLRFRVYAIPHSLFSSTTHFPHSRLSPVSKPRAHMHLTTTNTSAEKRKTCEVSCFTCQLDSDLRITSTIPPNQYTNTHITQTPPAAIAKLVEAKTHIHFLYEKYQYNCRNSTHDGKKYWEGNAVDGKISRRLLLFLYLLFWMLLMMIIVAGACGGWFVYTHGWSMKKKGICGEEEQPCPVLKLRAECQCRIVCLTEGECILLSLNTCRIDDILFNSRIDNLSKTNILLFALLDIFSARLPCVGARNHAISSSLHLRVGTSRRCYIQMRLNFVRSHYCRFADNSNVFCEIVNTELYKSVHMPLTVLAVYVNMHSLWNSQHRAKTKFSILNVDWSAISHSFWPCILLLSVRKIAQRFMVVTTICKKANKRTYELWQRNSKWKAKLIINFFCSFMSMQ